MLLDSFSFSLVDTAAGYKLLARNITQGRQFRSKKNAGNFNYCTGWYTWSFYDGIFNILAWK